MFEPIKISIFGAGDKSNKNEKKDQSKDNKNIDKDNKDNKDNKLEKKNKKREYKIYYSSYGYIKIDKAELDKNEPVVKFIQFRPAPFKAEDCILGKIYTLNCMKEINIRIKTFYNERVIHSIEKIDIFSTLQLVVKRMFEQERKEREKKEKEKDKKEEKKEEKEKKEDDKGQKEDNNDKKEDNKDKNEDNKDKNVINEDNKEKNEKNENKLVVKNENEKLDYEIERITEQTQYRIFSCHKQIHELNPTRNMFENEIQNNELLLYLPIKKLSFSQYAKGYSIIVSQEEKVASKINTDDPQYILGNIGYSFGKHYFEIILLTEPIARSVIVGLASKKNPGDMFSNEINNFYGYILSDMQKMSYVNRKEEKREYCREPIAINDIIGVLFEFKKEGLEISFYKNKICLGVAFNKIYNEKLFFPAVRLGLAGSKIQISNQIDFP